MANMFKAPHPPNGRSSASSTQDEQENQRGTGINSVPRSNSVCDDIHQVTAQINDFVLNVAGEAATAPLSSYSFTDSTSSVLNPLARPTAAAADNRHIAVVNPSTKQATVGVAPTPLDLLPRDSALSSDHGDLKYDSMTLHLKDDLPAQQEFITRSREETSDSSKPVDQTRALHSLNDMITEGSFTLWDANFKPLLLSVFGILSDATVVEDVMRLALKLMTKLCLAQAARLNTNAEACVLRVLEVGASGDWGTQVTVAAEECAKTLATHLSPEVIIRVLYPIVEAEADGARKELALKMLPTLVEHLDPDELATYLPDVAPGVVKVLSAGTEVGVRKAAALALVALHNKLGHEALVQFIVHLHPSKLRLMEEYIIRSQTASNHF